MSKGAKIQDGSQAVFLNNGVVDIAGSIIGPGRDKAIVISDAGNGRAGC